MKTKMILVAIGVIGVLLAWWGISTLLYYRSFTETAEGVVARRDDKEVIIRFHEERSSPGPQKVQFSGDAEYAFPLDAEYGVPLWTLKVGDKVKVYHAPGRLNPSEARFHKDFSYSLAGASAVAGAAFVVAAGVAFLLSGRRKAGLPLLEP